MGKRAVWAVHAGQEGDAEGLFLERNCIALGWPKTGDLSGLAKDRSAFKETTASA